MLKFITVLVISENQKKIKVQFSDPRQFSGPATRDTRRLDYLSGEWDNAFEGSIATLTESAWKYQLNQSNELNESEKHLMFFEQARLPYNFRDEIQALEFRFSLVQSDSQLYNLQFLMCRFRHLHFKEDALHHLVSKHI